MLLDEQDGAAEHLADARKNFPPRSHEIRMYAYL